jgi:hypothetical protein
MTMRSNEDRLAATDSAPASRAPARPASATATAPSIAASSADASRATGQRNLALRKAQDMLRGATGQATPMWIIYGSGRYRLDPTRISTDLWQFTAALDQARNTATGEDRLAACRTAAGLYHGELADGEGYEWAEPYAETARRRALDAWTTIADILAPRDPGQALAALESALSHDPYKQVPGGRTRSYELARAGTFPCPVMRAGRTYQVPTAGVLSLLGIPLPRTNSAGEDGR